MTDSKAPPDLRINHLREKIRLRDVMRHFGHSYRTNGNMLCCWHSEKNPSARLYDEQDTYWCWVCAPGHGVDIVEFVCIELGLFEERPTRGSAILAALDFLEENFATSYEGTPWENRMAEELDKLHRPVPEDTEKYWRARHQGILRQLCGIRNPAKWGLYSKLFADMRFRTDESIEAQAARWDAGASELASLEEGIAAPL